MMIRQKVNVREHKDYKYDKLIKERDKLTESIKNFEKKYFEGDRSGDEWHICPSPTAVYQCNLEYLSELCTFMHEKFNTDYVWGGK